MLAAGLGAGEVGGALRDIARAFQLVGGQPSLAADAAPGPHWAGGPLIVDVTPPPLSAAAAAADTADGPLVAMD